MAKLADYAGGRPGAQHLKDAGFDGAIRYMCSSPDRGLPNKELTPEEAVDFYQYGLELVSNHQRGKGPTAEWRGGYESGVREARYADQHHRECGGPPDRPIYFSFDEDISAVVWNDSCAPFLEGCASVIGKDRVGVYGGQRAMWWAQEDGWDKWLWQTCGWSRYEESPFSRSKGGIWKGLSIPVQWVEGTHIRQERIDRNGEVVNGITVDVNSTHADDYGQWNKSTVTTQPTPNPPDQIQESKMEDPVNRKEFDSPNFHYGNRDVDWIVIHTQEGAGKTLDIVNYCCRSSSKVAYNAIADDSDIYCIVPWDGNPWAAANANSRGDHILMAGSFAHWDERKWLEQDWSDGKNEDQQLTNTAKIAAWRCQERGIPPEYVGGMGMPTKPGICGHVDFGRWGGGHTDPGEQFPWEEFIKRVREFLNPRAEYDIEPELQSAWERNGAAGGFLGYAIGSVLSITRGIWQPFQGGDVYRLNDASDAWTAHGGIRDTWHSHGGKDGQFGWPITDEITFNSDTVYQDFENGRINWRIQSGPVAMLDKGERDEHA